MGNEFGVDVFAFAALAGIVVWLTYILYYILDLYFLTPAAGNIKLSAAEEQLLVTKLPAYSRLTLGQKKKFKNRVSRFRANKTFVFVEKSAADQEIKLLLSATAAYLTMGYRDYRIASIKKILIYPTVYFSTLTKKNHLGEYNPSIKLLVFSAEHMLSGYENSSDNLNLGVHEFAHALVFHFKTDLKLSAIRFRRGLAKMKALLSDEKFLQRVKATAYFREYATTNVHEFFSVALENYVETPSDFKRTFPELYEIITRMLNFGPYTFQNKHDLKS